MSRGLRQHSRSPLAARWVWSKSRRVLSFEPRFPTLTLRRRALLALALSLCLVVVAGRAPASQFGLPAQGATKPAASSASDADENTAPDSPRASMGEFTRFTRSGDYEKAARYLDLSAV